MESIHVVLRARSAEPDVSQRHSRDLTAAVLAFCVPWRTLDNGASRCRTHAKPSRTARLSEWHATAGTKEEGAYRTQTNLKRPSRVADRPARTIIMP